MKIHNHLQARGSRPADGLVEHLELALHVRLTVRRDHGPIPDGHPDMVQAGRAHLHEIIGGDERVPVLGQEALCCFLAQVLRQGPLVDGRVPSLFKEGRGDPGFQNQPSSEVDAAHLVAVVIEGQITRLDTTTTNQYRSLTQIGEGSVRLRCRLGQCHTRSQRYQRGILDFGKNHTGRSLRLNTREIKDGCRDRRNNKIQSSFSDEMVVGISRC
jgi:hypothetical protein